MQTLSPALRTGKRKPAFNGPGIAALDYAGRGWRVFPLHNPTSEGCSCKNPGCKSVGKHPRTEHGLKDASVNATVIRGWWERWPEANIGIATGPESGIFVLDIDGEDGQASLKVLEALKHFPKTARALTGRKGALGERTGFHLYFNCPHGANLRTSKGLLGKGIDIRAAGGYVVAPPSLHASGLRYEWVGDGNTIADLPPWLMAEASKPFVAMGPALRTGFLCEGERNDSLFRLACSWRRRGASKEHIERRLQVENIRRCRPNLENAEIFQIAANAARFVPGGPDALEAAWQKVATEDHCLSYEKFLALVRHLHNARPGLPILLPVVRISKLIGCDRTLVGRHRRKAVSQGIIKEIERYIPQKKATLFKVVTLP